MVKVTTISESEVEDRKSLSTLKDIDYSTLYELIPTLKDQKIELQTKVQELAEIIISRTNLSLAKIIEYYKECSITQGYHCLDKSKKVSRFYFTYDSQGKGRGYIQGLYKLSKQDQDKKIKDITENYINKIEAGNDTRAYKLLFKLSKTRGLLFAQYTYKAIHALVTGNLYAIVENRAFITSLFVDNVIDDFCNFEKLEKIIKEIIKKSKKDCHGAKEFINHILYSLKEEQIRSNTIPKDPRNASYCILREWQILYDFFKPYKEIKKEYELIENDYIQKYCEDYYNNHGYDLDEPIEIPPEYDCSYFTENYLDLISFIKTNNSVYVCFGDDLPFIDDDIKQDLINEYRALYVANQDVFSHDFISSNQFVESFNTVATCLFEFVFNKDIERFFS